MAKRDLNQQFPERQLKPSARIDSFLARRSGAYPNDRRTSPGMGLGGGVGGAGGGGRLSQTSGTTNTVASLPQDAANVATGTIYHVQGAEGEDDRLVYALRLADGTVDYRDVTQGKDAWLASFVGEFGTEGTANGEFDVAIRGLAVNPVDGSVYASSDDRIQKFDANGTFDSVIATVGTGDGQVDTPWGLAISDAGTTLAVADSANDRWQLFASDVFNSKFGTSGTSLGQFNGPRGIVISPANLFYIVDSGNNRVQFTENGFDYTQFGSSGAGNGEFDNPIGAAADRLGRIWVVDSGNHRVQVFDLLGAFLFSFGSFGKSKSQFNTPDSIAIDNRGNVYVTDSGNHRVQVFDNNGIFLGMFGRFGTGDGEFDTPTAIAVADDLIYVADSGNFRVQIFRNPVARQILVVGDVSQTYSPPSLAVGATHRLSMTVPGALPGDFVRVSHTAVGSLTVVFFGNVTTANAVDVFAHNINASSAQDVPSGTVRVHVSR